MEVLNSLGIESERIDNVEQVDDGESDPVEGEGYALRRGELTAFVFIAEDRITLEAVIRACHRLSIDAETFFAHYYDMKVRGEV